MCSEERSTEPGIWRRVLVLADELERTGDMCADAVDEFLPKRDAAWQPSAVASQSVQSSLVWQCSIADAPSPRPS